jgi:hypothetical protein
MEFHQFAAGRHMATISTRSIPPHIEKVSAKIKRGDMQRESGDDRTLNASRTSAQ